MNIRHGAEAPIFKDTLQQWYEKLPHSVTHGMSLDEMYNDYDGYYKESYKHFLEAYETGEGIKVWKPL